MTPEVEAVVKNIETNEVLQTGTCLVQEQGFTLIEVIISVFVVAFSVLAILEVFDLDIRSSNDARQQLKAAVRAGQLMEQVAQTRPPRMSAPPEVRIESTGLSERVTVNVTWTERDNNGAAVIVREFF